MKLRVARHVKELKPIIHFYCDLLGLQVKSTFENHSGYDGVILTFKDAEWEVEFTCSVEAPCHCTDEDDLLILKYEDETLYKSVIEKLNGEKNIEFAPRNPYWEEHGKLYKDPEGNGVIITLL